MRRIFRNSALALALCAFVISACARQVIAVKLDVRQAGDKPELCFDSDSEYMEDSVKLAEVGVARSTGATTPAVTYWEVEIPQSAPPVYLHRGDCIVYGQAIEGAKVVTPPQPLDAGMAYSFGLSTWGDGDGPLYVGGFCAFRNQGNGLRIVQRQKGQQSCLQGAGQP
jgi:hypothetical protein